MASTVSLVGWKGTRSSTPVRLVQLSDFSSFQNLFCRLWGSNVILQTEEECLALQNVLFSAFPLLLGTLELGFCLFFSVEVVNHHLFSSGGTK